MLEKKLSTISSEDYTDRRAAWRASSRSSNMVDRSTEKTILEALEEDDPELAEEIKKRMFVFEDIVLLDDRAIQKVLREVDTAELAKALKGVDAEVQDKIFRNMSKRASHPAEGRHGLHGSRPPEGRRGGAAEASCPSSASSRSRARSWSPAPAKRN